MQTELDRKPPKVPSIMNIPSVIVLPVMAKIDIGMSHEGTELEVELIRNTDTFYK
jgi:pyridoxal biosynthesis lyase PdxS